MSRSWLRSGALLAALLFAPSPEAESRSVSPGSLPTPVRDALARRFPRGEIRAAFHAAETPVGEAYEVRLSDGLRERELALDPRGEVLGEREAVSLSEVPEVAQRRLGRVAIWRAERLKAPEGTAYVLTFSRGSKLGTAVVREDGKLVGERVLREA
ncbi:MAG: hypothetical protein ACOZNI_21835 [Myxococcota bacterium]